MLCHMFTISYRILLCYVHAGVDGKKHYIPLFDASTISCYSARQMLSSLMLTRLGKSWSDAPNPRAGQKRPACHLSQDAGIGIGRGLLCATGGPSKPTHLVEVRLHIADPCPKSGPWEMLRDGTLFPCMGQTAVQKGVPPHWQLYMPIHFHGIDNMYRVTLRKVKVEDGQFIENIKLATPSAEAAKHHRAAAKQHETQARQLEREESP